MSNRLSVDIGGTFTDVVLDLGHELVSVKVLTTYDDPALGVMQGIEDVMQRAGVSAESVSLVLHGTTLATNALIERRGAPTALLTTQGHRDVLEMALENRFEQYDVNIDRPAPLVPRRWRAGIRQRHAADGEELLPLDEAQVIQAVDELVGQGAQALAIGFLHSYAAPAHEQRVAELIRARHPQLSISLSSDVCPEIREYERLSTTVANAYVQPLMARYLASLRQQLTEAGFYCEVLMMTSGGGLTTLQAAAAYPIRLVESGPAGGAILAAQMARQGGHDEVLAFDMGGTTAKLCLIDQGQPVQSRSFEVDRSYRFKKGSGLPVRIPVIEMVEIGAGGGSIAQVDAMQRVQVGPESAGSEPGPSAYGRGGERATVTDADVVLGRLTPELFAGGKLALQPERAQAALQTEVASLLQMSEPDAAFAVSEIVEENMASAARAHAAEWGQQTQGRTMIAFGGAAPLHAAGLARKLKISRVLVPAGAGVGSAIGFLVAPVRFEVVRSRYMNLAQFDAGLADVLKISRVLVPAGAGVGSAIGFLVAPVRFEVVRSRYMNLAQFDAGLADVLFQDMREEAERIVRDAVGDAALQEERFAYMRYVGQGYEVAVRLSSQLDTQSIRLAFEQAYESLYGRTIPGMEVEILSWTLALAAQNRTELAGHRPAGEDVAMTGASARVYEAQGWVDASVRPRASIGSEPIAGPVLVVEPQTTTVVPSGATVCCLADGTLDIRLED